MAVDLTQQLAQQLVAMQQVSGALTGANGKGDNDGEFEKLLQKINNQEDELVSSPEDKTSKPSGSEQNTEKADNTSQSKPAKSETEQNAQQNDEPDTTEPQALAASLVTSQPVPMPVVTVTAEQPAEVQQVEAVVVEPQIAGGETVMPPQQQQAAPVLTPEQNAGPTVASQANVAQAAAAPQEQTAQPAVVTDQAAVAPQTETVAQAAPRQEQSQPQLDLRQQSEEPQQLTEEAEVTEADEAIVSQKPLFNGEKAAPVKVGETQQPLEPEAEDAAAKLAQKINQALAEGESRVTLNLTPANLGSLTVEITRMADGTLSVVLAAVTEKAAGLLEKHSGTLQNLLLANMPGGTVKVDVENRMEENAGQQFLNPDQQEQNQQQEQQQSRRQHNQAEGQAAQTDFMQQLRLGLIDLENEQ